MLLSLGVRVFLDVIVVYYEYYRRVGNIIVWSLMTIGLLNSSI